MTSRNARRLLLAAAVAGLVLSIAGALLDATRFTTPVAVGLVAGAAVVDAQARARANRRR
jgi:hypothetical protein